MTSTVYGALGLALCAQLGGVAGCVGRARGLQPPPTEDPMRTVRAQQMVDEGMALARSGELVRAEQYLAEGLERGADPRRVLPVLLRVCVAASRFRAAVTYAAQYLERHPGDWALRFLVGTIHEELGEHFTARRHFEAVLTLREAHAGAHFMLGKILRDTYVNAAAADGHFRRYLELDPSGVFAEEARGSLLRAVVPSGDGDVPRGPVLRAVEPTPEPPAAARTTPGSTATLTAPATPVEVPAAPVAVPAATRVSVAPAAPAAPAVSRRPVVSPPRAPSPAVAPSPPPR